MAVERKYMLSSVDNPFNPFDQFESWLRYEMTDGDNAPGWLARFAHTNDDELSDSLNAQEVEDAITRAIVADPANRFKRVKRNETSQKNETKDEM